MNFTEGGNPTGKRHFLPSDHTEKTAAGQTFATSLFLKENLHIMTYLSFLEAPSIHSFTSILQPGQA